MSTAVLEAPRRPFGLTDHADAGDLVRAAACSERGAWTALVARFDGLVRSKARSFGLSNDDVADVSQAVWLHLLDHLDHLREPERVAGWLTTTTRHEALRLLRHQGRAIPTADPAILDIGDETPEPGTALAIRQRDVALTEVITTLPVRYRTVLAVFMVEPVPSYRDAAAALEMPVGSIGPTLKRCLSLLRGKCVAAGIAL